MHALASGKRDEKDLGDILARLDGAKADLTTRILTAHVGLSITVRDSFAPALPIIERADRNAQRVLDEIFIELEEELQKVQKEFRERMESEIAKPAPPPAASDTENSVSGKV
jgi:hypothetical protein